MQKFIFARFLYNTFFLKFYFAVSFVGLMTVKTNFDENGRNIVYKILLKITIIIFLVRKYQKINVKGK